MLTLVNNEHISVSLCLLPSHPTSSYIHKADSLEKCSLLGSFSFLELAGIPEPFSGSDESIKT